MLLRSRPPSPCVTYKKQDDVFINFDPSFCLCTDLWLADLQAYLLLSTGPPVRTDESIITTCSRLGPSCLIALNPVTELHQWAAWTACEGNPKHDSPFLDLSMAQLSIHAKIHSPICPNCFFDPMGGIESCDLNRSHHFIKKNLLIWDLPCISSKTFEYSIVSGSLLASKERISDLWHFCWWKPNSH